jgi:RNA-directed DNA polymerase
LEQFGLALNLDKTPLIEFGRFAAEIRRKQGEGKPETFDFLGFTHICTKTRIGSWFHVQRKTAKKRLRATLAEVKEAAFHRRMHDPIADVGRWLQRVVLGYYGYHVIPGNWGDLNAFRREVMRGWLATLRRRGQKRRMNWQVFAPIAQRWVPVPMLMQPYPNVRFDARHPR